MVGVCDDVQTIGITNNIDLNNAPNRIYLQTCDIIQLIPFIQAALVFLR
jgi:hypothetical protein